MLFNNQHFPFDREAMFIAYETTHSWRKLDKITEEANVLNWFFTLLLVVDSTIIMNSYNMI